METMSTINFFCWSTLVLVIMWATHSRHICDGVLIKCGLIFLAIGAAANAVKPTFESQVWVGCSLLVIMIFFLARILDAKVRGQTPVFISF